MFIKRERFRPSKAERTSLMYPLTRSYYQAVLQGVPFTDLQVLGSMIIRKYQSPPKGAGKLGPRENCRNISDIFWRFLTFFALQENCRKVSKIFLTLLTIFDVVLRWPLPLAPFAVCWKLIPWEFFFGIVEVFCTLKTISGKERLFRGIARDIRNF